VLWTSASGDDAVVGQAIPSTTVDPSKGTGTTLPTSSSNVDKAGDAGKHAVIMRLPRKIWRQSTCSEKSSYVSSFKLVIVGFCLYIE
jgi:hypothetical protein